MSIAFILLVAAVAVGVAGALWRYSPPASKHLAVGGFTLWVSYGAVLTYLGVLADLTRRPPGFVFTLIPAMAILILLVRSRWAKAFATAAPLSLLIGIQVFRVPLEVVLHALYRDGRLPQDMTFAGRNFDIVMGVSALVIALVVHTRTVPAWLPRMWNVVGIFMVVNVAAHGVHHLLTISPLAANSLAIGQAPFAMIPAFLAPLAIHLHVLTLRKLAAVSGASTTQLHG